MKKFAKISLVAALAIAGATSVNAQSLADAIKNVDVSGKAYVEFVSDNGDYTDGGKTDTTTNHTDLDLDITFKSKVNDNVTAVVRIQADDVNKENAKIATNQNVDLDNLYFTYANGPLALSVGKQNISTPQTDGERGNGALATYNLGPVTAVAAHYIENGITTDEISAAALLGAVGPVNLEAWYINATGHSDTVTLVASSKIGMVSGEVRYATSDFVDATQKDGDTLKVTLGADFGVASISATYFKTDEDNASYVSDVAAANSFELSQLNAEAGSGTMEDLEIWQAAVTVPMGAMTYQIAYADLEQDSTKTDADELRLRATYAMSSNFKIMATYSMYEEDIDGANENENDSARLEAKYTF